MTETDHRWTGRETGRLPPIGGEGTRKPWGVRERVQLAIRFRFADGTSRSFAYHNFNGTMFLGGVIKVFFVDGTVTIFGRHLSELDDRLCDWHVAYVQEQHASEFEVEEHEPYIDRIELAEPKLEEALKRPAMTTIG